MFFIKTIICNLKTIVQSFHRLEIYFKLEVCFLKLIKKESGFETIETNIKGLEKNLNFIIFCSAQPF